MKLFIYFVLASWPSCPGFDSQHCWNAFREKMADAALVNQRCCLEKSGQWLENVDQTHLVLASGKLVLQKQLFLYYLLSWTCPQTWNFGRTWWRIRWRRSLHPQWSPNFPTSPNPSGGPWVTRMSVSSGMLRHLSDFCWQKYAFHRAVLELDPHTLEPL